MSKKPLKAVPSPKEVAISYYTKENWFKYHKNTNHNEWEAMDYENVFDKYIDDTFDRLESLGANTENIEKLKYVVIDEEYDKWLKQNALKHSEENISKYVLQVNESTAKKLWKKYKCGDTCYTGCILFASTITKLINNKTYFRIQNSNKLKKILESLYPKKKILLSSQVLLAEELYEVSEKYYNDMIISDDNKLSILNSEYDYQEYEPGSDGSIGIFAIPYVIRETNGPIIDAQNFFDEDYFSKASPYQYPHFPIKEFEILSTDIATTIEAEEKFVAALASCEEIPQACDDITKAINNQIDKHSNKK